MKVIKFILQLGSYGLLAFLFFDILNVVFSNVRRKGGKR